MLSTDRLKEIRENIIGLVYNDPDIKLSGDGFIYFFDLLIKESKEEDESLGLGQE